MRLKRDFVNGLAPGPAFSNLGPVGKWQALRAETSRMLVGVIAAALDYNKFRVRAGSNLQRRAIGGL